MLPQFVDDLFDRHTLDGRKLGRARNPGEFALSRKPTVEGRKAHFEGAIAVSTLRRSPRCTQDIRVRTSREHLVETL